LGTSLPEEYIPYLKKYNKVLIAFDRDATVKALDLSSRLCYNVSNVQVILLEDDLKYFDENKIREILYEKKNTRKSA